MYRQVQSWDEGSGAPHAFEADSDGAQPRSYIACVSEVRLECCRKIIMVQTSGKKDKVANHFVDNMLEPRGEGGIMSTFVCLRGETQLRI